MTGDQIACYVSWNSKTDLSGFFGQEIVMAFRMHSAKLFSFEFVK